MKSACILALLLSSIVATGALGQSRHYTECAGKCMQRQQSACDALEPREKGPNMMRDMNRYLQCQRDAEQESHRCQARCGR